MFLGLREGSRVSHGLNLIKLSVGSESVESISNWQSTKQARRHNGKLCHVTRMWPRREGEIVEGGSIYWVIRGLVLARQNILGFEAHEGQDGIKRCAIVLDEDLIRTVPQPRKAFQGWRYLAGSDAPLDLDHALDISSPLPPNLEQELAQIGVLARSRK